jgi:hypothetical protein
MGFLDEEGLIRTLARQLKLPIAWLRGKWVEEEVLDLVPSELALKHRCLPLAVNDAGHGKVLHLAMQDPGDLVTLDAVRFHVGHDVSPVLAAPSELEEALQRHYEAGKSEAGAAASRPEVQEVPELLMFELKAQAATPETELDFEFGTRTERRVFDVVTGGAQRSHAAPDGVDAKGHHQSGRGRRAVSRLLATEFVSR